MSKEFIDKQGLPPQIKYSNEYECIADNSKDSQEFLNKYKKELKESFKGKFLYICKYPRNSKKFFGVFYENGYFWFGNLSIFCKTKGKFESYDEGLNELSYRVIKAVKYGQNCSKSGGFNKRNFYKLKRDLGKAFDLGRTIEIAGKFDLSKPDDWLRTLRADTKIKAYIIMQEKEI